MMSEKLEVHWIWIVKCLRFDDDGFKKGNLFIQQQNQQECVLYASMYVHRPSESVGVVNMSGYFSCLTYRILLY